jgi:hypothetical protein
MKYLKRLAQETGFSITSARRATKLWKLGCYKTTVVHTFWLVSSVCTWWRSWSTTIRHSR